MYKRGLIQLATKKYNMDIINSLSKFKQVVKINIPGKNSIRIYQPSRATEYQKQFEIKRAIKNYYGINKIDSLINIESRLDVILFRLYFVRNLEEARDLIKKGMVKVNNKIVLNSNFKVLKGSSIKVDHIKIPSNLYFRSILPNFKLPSYLLIKSFNEGILIRSPNFKEFTFPKNLNIKKYYSR